MKLALIAVVILLTGCTRMVDAHPVKEPQRIDCDLVFPGPSAS
jgi:hypothetical protein